MKEEIREIKLLIALIILCSIALVIYELFSKSKPSKSPPKSLGELRINPVINQLKFDIDEKYYK